MNSEKPGKQNPVETPFRPEMKRSFLYIYVLSFFSGMCIMAIELCASRLVAPYFGTSSFVWTNIIGVIMIALSAGYVIGGKLADRKPRLGILLKLLLVACGFAPPVSGSFLSSVIMLPPFVVLSIRDPKFGSI